MGNAIEKLAEAGQLKTSNPEEVTQITDAVREATIHTAKMTDEMVQLNEALDRLDGKNKIYRRIKNQTKIKMQSILTEL